MSKYFKLMKVLTSIVSTGVRFILRVNVISHLALQGAH